MNLTSGVPLKQALDVATIDFPGLFRELKGKSFNGYACLAVQGAIAIEEGTLVFDNGKVVACFYEYYKHNKLLVGEQAFPRVMNATAAKVGVLDIYALKNEEVQLMLAFYERAIYLPSEKDLFARVERFDDKFEKEIAEPEGERKEETLKKYRIADVRVGEYKTENVAPEGQFEDLLEKMKREKE
ncbi:MAG TPA: DUF2226 domain-containing protein [Candidatus Norongarragalinales archaeon]|nr:DUF2226 domain-containing protein [Candidatus Norongarragalinales archaeon]